MGLYGFITQTLLWRPTSENLTTIFQIFERQHLEGIPVDPKILTRYLKAIIDNTSISSSIMKTIASIFPFLPETYDLHLLTLILSMTVKHANATPREVKEMINACVAQQNGGNEVEMQEWDLDLWDIYMGSLLANGYWREGVKSLSDFQAAVWAKRGIKTKGEDESSKVTRVYITFLTYWIESTFPDKYQQPRRYRSVNRNRFGSETPRSIVRHCFGTLGEVMPPVELFNVWMRAEIVAGNLKRAEKIWEIVSGRGVDGSFVLEEVHGKSKALRDQRTSILEHLINSGYSVETPSPISCQLPKSLGPDVKTYSNLFALLKRQSTPPSRRLLRHYLRFPKNIDTDSLNSALSTIFITSSPTPSPQPDLPAALLLLQQFAPITSRLSDIGSTPTARTLDIVSGGLIRASQAGLRIFRGDSPSLISSVPSSALEPVNGRLRRRTRLKDWDKISWELHQLRDLEPKARELLLPVGQPFARLVQQYTPPTPGSAEVGSMESEVLALDYHSAEGRSDTISELFPALQRLMHRAIAAQRSIGEDGVDELLRQARVEIGLEHLGAGV